MSRIEENLALQKEILIARSSLCRLKVRLETHALRRSLTWHEAGAVVAQTPAAREAVFLLATAGLGRDRMARWLMLAGRILAVAKLTTIGLEMLRTRTDGPAGRSPP